MIAACLQCGKAVERAPSEVASKRTFCSRACWAAFRYKAPDPPERNCLHCGAPLLRRQGEERQDWIARRFCNQRCHYAYASLMARRADTGRRCIVCGASMVRRRGETLKIFARRMVCGVACLHVTQRGPRIPASDRPQATCEHCGRVFMTTRWKAGLTGVNRVRYCSRACTYAARRRTITTQCHVCSVTLRNKPLRFSRSKSGLAFCSRACFQQWRTSRRRLNFNARRLSRYTERDLLVRAYGDRCVCCGWDRCVEYAHILPAREGGTTHPNNIAALCPNHHVLFDRGQLTDEELAAINARPISASASVHSLVLSESGP